MKKNIENDNCQQLLEKETLENFQDLLKMEIDDAKMLINSEFQKKRHDVKEFEKFFLDLFSFLMEEFEKRKKNFHKKFSCNVVKQIGDKVFFVKDHSEENNYTAYTLQDTNIWNLIFHLINVFFEQIDEKDFLNIINKNLLEDNWNISKDWVQGKNLQDYFLKYEKVYMFIKPYLNDYIKKKDDEITHLKDYFSLQNRDLTDQSKSNDLSKIIQRKNLVDSASQKLKNINRTEDFFYFIYFLKDKEISFFKKFSSISSHALIVDSKLLEYDIYLLDSYREKIKNCRYILDEISFDPAENKDKEKEIWSNELSLLEELLRHNLDKKELNQEDIDFYFNYLEKIDFYCEILKLILVLRLWVANPTSQFNKSIVDKNYDYFQKNINKFSPDIQLSIYNVFWILFNLVLEKDSAENVFDKWINSDSKLDKSGFIDSMKINKKYYHLVDIVSDLQVFYTRATFPERFDIKTQKDTIESELIYYKAYFDNFLLELQSEWMLCSWLINQDTDALKSYFTNEICRLFDDGVTEWFVGRFLLNYQQNYDNKVVYSKMQFAVLNFLMCFYFKKLFNNFVDSFNLSNVEKYDINYYQVNYWIDKDTIKTFQKRWTLESDYLARIYNTIMTEQAPINKLPKIDFEETIAWNYDNKLYNETDNNFVNNIIKKVAKTYAGGLEYFTYSKLLEDFKSMWKIKFNHIIRLIFWIIDNFDLSYSEWHSKRVANNASKIAEIIFQNNQFRNSHEDEIKHVELEIQQLFHNKLYKWIEEFMNKDAWFVDALYLSGLLHDCGKVATDLLTLSSRIPLSDEEFEEIKSHSKRWEKVLKSFLWEQVSVPQFIIYWISHHERPDGKWYPYQLKEWQISLVSSIMAIADSIDAMLTKRCYNSTKSSLEYVFGELERWKWLQFDKDIIDLLLHDEDFTSFLIENYYWLETN